MLRALLVFAVAVLHAPADEFRWMRAGKVATPVTFVSYADAYNSGKPTLIVVTAEWCSACPKFKESLRTMGEDLKDHAIVELDIDKDSALVATVAGNVQRIPFVVRFDKNHQRTGYWTNPLPAVLRAGLSR